MTTCSVRSKRCDQYQIDNRETNNELNPLYLLKLIFYQVIFCFSFVFEYGNVANEVETKENEKLPYIKN